jgi:hypothetical protein
MADGGGGAWGGERVGGRGGPHGVSSGDLLDFMNSLGHMQANDSV